MNYRETNSKIVITGVGILVALFLLAIFVVRPQLRKITDLRTRITESQNKAAALQVRIADYRLAAKELQKVSGQKAALAALYPAREQMESLVLGLEQAAASSGVLTSLKITDALEAAAKGESVSEAKPPVVAGLSGLTEVPFTLDLSGTYRQLTDFFMYFDNSPYLTRITSLSVAADQDQGETAEILRNTGIATPPLLRLVFFF